MSEMRSESDPTAVLPRRIAAFIIDTIILGGFASIMLLPGLLFIAKGDVDPATDVCVDPPGVCFMSADNSQVFFADTGNAAAAVLLPILLWLLMHVVLQGLTGATPGKALMGLRTVKNDGYSVAGIGRTFTRALPAILIGIVAAAGVYFLKEQFNTYRDAQVALGVPALAILGGSVLSLAIALLTSGNRGIGDRVAKTAVIGKQFLGQTGFGSTDARVAGYPDANAESVDASAAIAGATGAGIGGAAATTAWDIPDTPAPQAPLGQIDPSAGNSFPPPPAPDVPAPAPPSSGLFASAPDPGAPAFDPTLPEAPAMPAAPDIPAPDMPAAADPFGAATPSESFFDPTLPETPSAPAMPDAPAMPAAPDMPAAPEMPSAPAPSGVPADPFDQQVSSENPFDVAPPEPEPSILDSFGSEPEPVHEPVDMDTDPFATEPAAPAAEAPVAPATPAVPATPADVPTPMADAAALPADPFGEATDPFSESATPAADPFTQAAGVPAADPFANQPDPAAEAQAAQAQAEAQAAEAQAAEQQRAAEAAALQQQQAAQQAQAEQQAQAAEQQQSQAGVEGPQWDDARNTYIQWDPVLKAWMQWDQPGGRWIPIQT